MQLAGSPATFVPGVDTILLNVSGKLITINPKFSTKDDSGGEDFSENRFQVGYLASIIFGKGF